jgi:sugar/nucleoside kinase (ribokinase family)
VTARILVAGDLLTDVLIRPSGPLEPGTDTAAEVTVTGGGAGGNLAAWLAAAGATVTLAARVGADPAGRDRVAELAAAGVSCVVVTDPAARTGTIAVVVGPDGERSMFTDRGASALLRPGDIDVAAARAGHLHVSGYLLLDAGTRPAALGAVAAARSAGMTVSADAASVAPLRAAGPQAFLGWTAGLDLLLANAAEAAALTGRPDPVAAAAVLARTVRAAVVTWGAAGAIWCSPAGAARIAGEPAHVADTTGAGDAFAAGLLTAWLSGSGPEDCLRAGGRLGALAVSRTGARP